MPFLVNSIALIRRFVCWTACKTNINNKRVKEDFKSVLYWCKLHSVDRKQHFDLFSFQYKSRICQLKLSFWALRCGEASRRRMIVEKDNRKMIDDCWRCARWKETHRWKIRFKKNLQLEKSLGTHLNNSTK